MTDREKVIKGLQEAVDWLSTETSLTVIDQWVVRDALALLKAQEPRVMTLEEAKSAYVIEYRSGKIREFGSALLDINVDPLNAEYGKIYRVWTSRPTDEQREAVKWE